MCCRPCVQIESGSVVSLSPLSTSPVAFSCVRIDVRNFLRRHWPTSTRSLLYADQFAVHDSWKIASREDPLPPRDITDQDPGRLDCLQAGKLRGPRALEPGCSRHPGPEVLPQGRRTLAPQAPGRDA